MSGSVGELWIIPVVHKCIKDLRGRQNEDSYLQPLARSWPWCGQQPHLEHLPGQSLTLVQLARTSPTVASTPVHKGRFMNAQIFEILLFFYACYLCKYGIIIKFVACNFFRSILIIIITSTYNAKHHDQDRLHFLHRPMMITER